VAGSAQKGGFETSIRVPSAPFVAVRALDAAGASLGQSPAVAPK
jgi:hypothetical protein